MYKDLFKNPNFTLLSIGGFISSIGDYLYNIGITVFLYSMTKSVNSVALMWLSRAVLRIPMLYLSGIIADKYNRKHVIVLTNLISVVIAFLFIFAVTDKIWLIYLGTFLLQSLNDIDVNSETAILPELVSKDQLSQSNSIFSFLQSTSVFVSPALGGILYKLYGANVLFIINAISFLVAGVLFAYIKYSYVKPEKASAKVGIIYFDYALAIGGLSVPFIVKALAKHNQVIIFTISTMAVTVGFTLFGYSHSFIFTFIVLIILGAAQNIQGTYSNTIIQNNISKNYIGRVFSFYKMLITFFAILGLFTCCFVIL